MSLVRTDQLAAYLGQSSPPVRAQSSLDMAETVIGAYLSIQGGEGITEHTVSEYITPVRDRTTLEVSGGPVTGVESVAYNVSGYRSSGDEVANAEDQASYLFDPNFSGWLVAARNSDGTVHVFEKGREYRVTYRTGWSVGQAAYSWEWKRNSAATFVNADRLGWTFAGGEQTENNASGSPVFGMPDTSAEGIYYETGAVSGDDRLVSPALSFDGNAYPFIVARLNLERASTTGNAVFDVEWKDGDGRTYFTGKKASTFPNFLPDRMRASTIRTDHSGYTTIVVDMGFQSASQMDEQMRAPMRSWRDATITSLALRLWDGGASDPNGARFILDYVRVCDGTARLPSSIKKAVLETARSISAGGGQGVVGERIGDYSRNLDADEASEAIPPVARLLLDPYRRPAL